MEEKEEEKNTANGTARKGCGARVKKKKNKRKEQKRHIHPYRKEKKN
jgi:hypothetical protein